MKKIVSVVLLLFVVQLSLFVPVSHSEEGSGSAKSHFETKRENVIEARHDFRQDVKQNREDAKEHFKDEREKFKENLQSLKDERKKKIVERIDSRLLAINTNATDRMTNVLEKLNEILSKIKEKTSVASASGKDVASVETAIASAETSIATAQSAVTAQAGKEYVADISDEAALREVIGKVIKQLQSDLKATHQAVVGARKAVRNAAAELAKVNGETGESK